MKKLILASASPRRMAMLDMLGLQYTAISPDVDEDGVQESCPQALATRLSQMKAECVLAQHPDAIVIASDTVVFCHGHILGKPADDNDARRILRLLSDTTHQVYSGISVATGNKIVTDCNATDVTFRKLSEDDITAYIATGEGRDKAGAFGLQEMGGLFVTSINGDFNTVVGMPLFLMEQILREEFGYSILHESNKQIR
ncbi:MAG: Maf family protein [Oscillospiraceae bacterium]|nr:Maf family protein [Oscillospiraceae bacterium]